MYPDLFKVGQKVRAVKASHGWGDVNRGDIGVIKARNGSKWKVDFPAQSGWNAEDRDLEAITEPLATARMTDTTPEFKVGDHICCRPGDHGYSCTRGKWEGIVIAVRDDGHLKAKTTVIDNNATRIGEEFGGLRPSAFLLKTTQPTKEKEKQSMSINSNVLVRMASSSLEKDLTDAGVQGLPANIREALEEQLADEKKNSAKAAASEIVKLLKQHDASVESSVAEIRALRKREKKVLADIEKVNRAKAYGIETSNFVPLLVALGNRVSFGDDVEVITEVPKDWAPAPSKKD